MRYILSIFVTLCLALAVQAEDIVLNDFESDDLGGWAATGTAFGSVSSMSGPGDSVTGFQGRRFASSLAGGKDATGTLTSPEFIIERGYINFLVSGGSWPDDLKIELLLDGETLTRISHHPGI